MCVVIVGGHERMECQYKEICKGYGCKAKIFTKRSGGFKKSMGSVDLFILFTNTVSHKMVLSANQVAKKGNIPIERVHTSSASALHEVLGRYYQVEKGGTYE